MALTKAQKEEKARKVKQAAKVAYNNEYNKRTYLNYSFRLNKDTEFLIINHLAQQPEGLKAYLVNLIMKDIKNQRRRMKVTTDGEA